VTDEIDGIDQALSDDTLTQQAKDDLTAARAKLVATQTAVQGLLSGLDTSATSAGGSDRGDCNGRRGRGAQQA
jgi:hypothetical protein